MGAKKPETEAPNMEELVKNLTQRELQQMAMTFARAAAEAREEGRGRELPPSHLTGPRDTAVQRLAGITLDKLLRPKTQGGEGMSLRDVASMLGITYERVRSLAMKLVPEYEEIASTRRRNNL